jgi:hypothetical protein
MSSPSLRAPAAAYKRQRNQFKAWLIWQLNLRGANLPARPSYRALQVAVNRYLAPRA